MVFSTNFLKSCFKSFATVCSNIYVVVVIESKLHTLFFLATPWNKIRLICFCFLPMAEGWPLLDCDLSISQKPSMYYCMDKQHFIVSQCTRNNWCRFCTDIAYSLCLFGYIRWVMQINEGCTRSHWLLRRRRPHWKFSIERSMNKVDYVVYSMFVRFRS